MVQLQKTKNGPEGPPHLPVDCEFGPRSASVEGDIGEWGGRCKRLWVKVPGQGLGQPRRFCALWLYFSLAHSHAVRFLLQTEKFSAAATVTHTR